MILKAYLKNDCHMMSLSVLLLGSKMLNKLFIVFVFAISGNVFAGSEIEESAKKLGFNSCLSTVADMEKFLTDGKDFGHWATTAMENPDQQFFNSSIELNFKDGMQLVDMTITPSKDGMCSIVYTRNWFSANSCISQVKESFMKGFTYKSDINKKVSFFENSDGAKILLMPAGDGCLLQKKEIVYRYKKQEK